MKKAINNAPELQEEPRQAQETAAENAVAGLGKTNPLTLCRFVVVTSETGLNLRGTPFYEGTVVRVLPKGMVLMVLQLPVSIPSVAPGWLPVMVGPALGWVDARYVSESGQQAEEAQQAEAQAEEAPAEEVG